MRRLRVRDPDTLTRVTEYVPEVVAFVERIVANGYGYEVDGSVYFNTAAFDGKEDHVYAKLEPWSRGNLALLEEGEGFFFPFLIPLICWYPTADFFFLPFKVPWALKRGGNRPLISSCGRHPRPANPPGPRLGAQVVQDGTSNAL
jgi:hypothetical protein